ncbi:hypothetical protein NUACC26_099900 [Scytonema sp. NUACC26]
MVEFFREHLHLKTVFHQHCYMNLKQLAPIFAIYLLTCPIWLHNSAKAQQQDIKLVPFFDNENNPVSVDYPERQQLDISPPAPQLNPFDKAVLNVCGLIGTRVSPNKFRSCCHIIQM